MITQQEKIADPKQYSTVGHFWMVTLDDFIYKLTC